MKTLILTAALSLTVFIIAGCNDKPADGTAGTAAVPAADVKPYPLDVCVVSGEKLGSMGKPVEFDYQGQHIKLCCKNCKPDFEKEPAKFLAKLGAK